MSVGSYQRAASSNNSSTSNGGDGPPATAAAAAAAGSVRLAGDNTKDRMYEPKHHQKAVRVLTVVAYIFFVSLAAITLSLYYVFIYDPPPQPQQTSSQMFGTGGGAGANGNPYSAPIVINITDCKQVVAVAVVNRTQPTPVMETPRVLAVGPLPSSEPLVAQADRSENRTAASDDVNSGWKSNSTRYGYRSDDYSKGVANDADYYT